MECSLKIEFEHNIHLIRSGRTSSPVIRFGYLLRFTIGKLIDGMVDNEAVARIAQKIRATRLKKNLTIQQLATRTSLSQGLLSKIENVRTVPSLPVLIALVQSLDISFKDFFKDMILFDQRDYLLVKKEQHKQLERKIRSGLKYQSILSRNVPNCTMEATLLTVKPGAKGRAITTEGYEFRYILSGTCEYRINNELIMLEEGDSLYVDASVPHIPVNKTGKEVLMLVIYFIPPK